jgi:hypothetical protein
MRLFGVFVLAWSLMLGSASLAAKDPADCAAAVQLSEKEIALARAFNDGAGSVHIPSDIVITGDEPEDVAARALVPISNILELALAQYIAKVDEIIVALKVCADGANTTKGSGG